MRFAIPLLVLASALAPPQPAAAAERSFTLTSFDRIRVDGPFAVELVTGVSPFARASGSQAALDTVAMSVTGRTLLIHPNRSSWGGYPGQPVGPVTITVGTHELSSATLNGSGSLAVDHAKGLSFAISVNGAGAVRIAQVEADRVTIGLNGAGSATLAGTTAKLTGIVHGASSLDSSALLAKAAVIGAEGPAVVRLAASETAQLSASGTASIAVSGDPACTVKIAGSASVSGCR